MRGTPTQPDLTNATWGQAPDFPLENEYAREPAANGRKRRLLWLPAILVLGLVCGGFRLALPTQVLAYEVQLGSRKIGIVKNVERLQKDIDRLRVERSAQYGSSVQFAAEVQLTPIYTAPKYITATEEVLEAFDAFSDIQVSAAAIRVEGEIAAATATTEDAQWVIDQVIEPYKLQKERGRIEKYEMIEDVRIETAMVPASLVMSRESAYHALMVGTNESRMVTVKAGESIHTIAGANGLSVSDLKKANPKLFNSDVVQAGDQLNLVVPRNQLNVRYYRKVDDTIDLPFKTEVKLDGKKVKTQKEILEEGKKGTQQVVAMQEYVGGIKLSETILERKILMPAVNQVISKGTKEVSLKSGSLKNAKIAGFMDGEVSAEGFSWPASGTLSSQYGQRWNRLHAGIDIATVTGTPVYASRAGTVKTSGYHGGYGKSILIDHGDGVQTRYAHNSQLLKKAGDKVERGELIALSGNTGNSTGPHVHFEIIVNNVAVNPIDRLPLLRK